VQRPSFCDEVTTLAGLSGCGRRSCCRTQSSPPACRLAELDCGTRGRPREEPTAALQLELVHFKSKLAAQTHTLFGRRPNSGVAPARNGGRNRAPARGHGAPQPSRGLPLVAPLPADETCPQCGRHLEPWKDPWGKPTEIDVVERDGVPHRARAPARYQSRERGLRALAVGPEAASRLALGARHARDAALIVEIRRRARR